RIERRTVKRALGLKLLCPGSVDFADVLSPTHGANFPSDIVRNRDHPQLCTMAIGSSTQFLDDLGKLDVIPGDQHSALIKAWFFRRCSLRPIGAKICFLECILLAQFAQS